MAFDELKEMLQRHCPQLFEYPNFVGTIQDFVDTFLALPYYIQKYRHRTDIIDADRYNHCCDAKMRYASTFLKTKMPYYQDIRYGINENGDEILTTGLNGRELAYPRAKKWLKDGTSEAKVSQMRNTIERMKSSLMEEGTLHFDDCYHLAEMYIRKYPDVIRILRARFAYVFVDEAQDMQRHQLSIIDKIFNCNEVVLQRIGDPNQSIFDGFSAQNRWESRNPTYISNSMRLTAENASIVNHLVLERGSDNNGNDRFVVNGMRVLPAPIAPHLILYTDGTMSRLKDKFREVIRANNLHLLPEAAKYGFHIIGWNAERSQNPNYRHLEDIFTDYHRNQTKQNSVFQTLGELIQQEKHVGSFELSRRCVLEAFAVTLNKLDIRASDNRQYTVNKVLSMVADIDEKRQREFHEELFDDVKLLSQGKWNESYNCIKHLITKWLTDFFETVPNDDVSSFLGTVFEQKLPEHDNHVDPEEIPITIGTVHSVKGMTHCATMYVETAYRNKYESQYMIIGVPSGRGKNKTITYTSPFFKQDIETTATTSSMVKRLLYVGFSRPTHLMCYASNRNLWNEDMLNRMENSGWIIENM